MSTVAVNDRPTRTVLAGVLTAATAVILAVYSAYGDPYPKAEQKSPVPFLAGCSLVAAALAFPLLLPWLSSESSRRWSIVTGAIAVLAAVAAFWSGVPLVLGVVVAMAGRRNGSKASVVLGVVAVGISLGMAILGNTIMSSP